MQSDTIHMYINVFVLSGTTTGILLKLHRQPSSCAGLRFLPDRVKWVHANPPLLARWYLRVGNDCQTVAVMWAYCPLFARTFIFCLFLLPVDCQVVSRGEGFFTVGRYLRTVLVSIRYRTSYNASLFLPFNPVHILHV